MTMSRALWVWRNYLPRCEKRLFLFFRLILLIADSPLQCRRVAADLVVESRIVHVGLWIEFQQFNPIELSNMSCWNCRIHDLFQCDCFPCCEMTSFFGNICKLKTAATRDNAWQRQKSGKRQSGVAQPGVSRAYS